MPPYILTYEAAQDLREIAQYTLQKWGAKQLETYRKALNKQLKAIGANEAIKRRFSPSSPDILFTKAGAHFIFYMQPAQGKPIIIAVLHEARDIVQHLASRLD